MTEQADQNKKKNVVIVTLSPGSIAAIDKLTTSIVCLIDTFGKR